MIRTTYTIFTAPVGGTDTFSNTGNGTTVDASNNPCKYFSIQVTEVGGTATSWTVILEGNIGGSDWQTICTHTKLTSGSGKVVWNPTPSVCSYIRARCSELTLGSATSISCKSMGLP